MTSEEYCLRYSDHVLWDVAALSDFLDCRTASDFADGIYTHFDFDGDVAAVADGVELIQFGHCTRLTYPFTVADLRDVVDELDELDEL